MSSRYLFTNAFAIFSCMLSLTIQSASQAEKVAKPNSGRKLEIVRRVESQEFARNIVGFPSCDEDGNIYQLNDYDASSAISKFDEKGQRVALFRADSVSDLKIDFSWNFSVSRDGIVRQIMYEQDSPRRYVAVFSRDGTYNSKVKLDPGFEFVASEVAAFPSGDMIVTGLRLGNGPGAARPPFTGIFASGGGLVKEVVLSDDKELEDLASNGDPRVVSSPGAKTNSAVERGGLEIGADGNAYIMRRLSPALFYVVSPGGAVLRRLTVDPGPDRQNYMPISMHLSNRRIAILFHESQTKNQMIKVVDFEGHPIASYEDELVGGKPQLGVSFACFLDSPERYLFLGETERNRLEFKTVEPK